jgi:hypothetical protein
MTDNHGFTLNADNFINHLIRTRWISLLVVALSFERTVGKRRSGRRLFQESWPVSFEGFPASTPAAHPQTEKTRVSRRPASRIPSAAEASPSPTPIEEASSKPAKEEKTTPTALPASAAPAAKTKGDMPYGIPVPGRKGMVTSPYLPEGNYIDVSAFAPGSAVRDPYTGKIFRVP